MPRGRIIDKRISKSQKFARLKLWTSRCLYLMMYPHVDIEGKLEATPELLKGEVCPLLNITPKKIMECLEDLEAVKLIKLWENGDDYYLQITRFEEFQSLRPDREAPSKISGPDQENSGVDRGGPKKDGLKFKSKSKFKSKDKTTTTPNGKKTVLRSSIDFSFENRFFSGIDISDKTAWIEAYPACDIDIELKRAAEWLLSNPTKRKKNYRRFIVNWLSRSQEKGGTNNNGGKRYGIVD